MSSRRCVCRVCRVCRICYPPAIREVCCACYADAVVQRTPESLTGNIAMTQATPLLFDFAPFAGKSEQYVELIKQFAAAQSFRSATVDELLLDDDYHRRPLRPEDFEFLKFAKPVRQHNVSRLPSLAANRTLLSIYELGIARLPRSAEAAEWQHFSEFYRDDVQVRGAQLAPFLESYA